MRIDPILRSWDFTRYRHAPGMHFDPALKQPTGASHQRVRRALVTLKRGAHFVGRVFQTNDLIENQRA